MQNCDPKAIARCPYKRQCGDNPYFSDGSDCDKFNQRICNEPPTNADRIPGAAEVDKAAHRVFMAAGRDDDIRWRPSCVKCRACATELEIYYCEERLYMVRCRRCGKVVLLKSSGPRFAAEEANDGPTE